MCSSDLNMTQHLTKLKCAIVLMAIASALCLAVGAWAQELPTIDGAEDLLGGEEPFDEMSEVVEFPYEESPLWSDILEATPTVLSWPDEPLGNFFAHLLGKIGRASCRERV